MFDLYDTLNLAVVMKFFFYLLLAVILPLYGCQTEKDNSKTSSNEEKIIISEDSENKPIILFLGTSLTAAYGLDLKDGFPSLIQKTIDSLQLSYHCVNGGITGETTAGLLSRLDWMLQGEIAVIVIESGANDGLRGTDAKTTKENLTRIIEQSRKKYPNVKLLLAGMKVPPNMGKEYERQFESIYPELSKKYDIPLIPFLLEKVGGYPKLNQKDRIHPTAEGQKIVAETVWKYLKPLLDKSE